MSRLLLQGQTAADVLALVLTGLLVVLGTLGLLIWLVSLSSRLCRAKPPTTMDPPNLTEARSPSSRHPIPIPLQQKKPPWQLPLEQHLLSYWNQNPQRLLHYQQTAESSLLHSTAIGQPFPYKSRPVHFSPIQKGDRHEYHLAYHSTHCFFPLAVQRSGWHELAGTGHAASGIFLALSCHCQKI